MGDRDPAVDHTRREGGSREHSEAGRAASRHRQGAKGGQYTANVILLVGQHLQLAPTAGPFSEAILRDLLRLGLCEFLRAGARNSQVRRLGPLESGPSTGFDEVALLPGLYLLELQQLYRCAGLLHEFRDTRGRESNDEGGIGAFYGHPFGGTPKGPA